MFVLPLIGGLTVRPIPYQVTAAGDVMLDLALANDLIPKSEVTFPCELPKISQEVLQILIAINHGANIRII